MNRYDDYISRQDLIDELFPRGTYILGQALYAKDVYNAIVRMKGVKSIPVEKTDLAELALFLEEARAKAAGKPDALLAALRLSPRVYNALSAGNRIKTVGDLLQYSAVEITHIRQLGPKGIDEIRERLDDYLNQDGT